MKARLVVIGGKTNLSEIKLKLPSVFGRGREADITISHAAVSRQHCRIEELDGALLLRDNGSTNGTYFGKKRIKEIVIRPGDLFSIGPLTFRAEYEHEGPFPAVGEPRPDESRDDATIQFTPGENLDGFAALDPHTPEMANGAEQLDFTAADKPLADEAAADSGLDFLDEPEAAGAAEAKADSGIDFLGGPEPVDEAEAKADSGLDFLGEPEPATANKPAESPAAAEADDDFLAAFEDETSSGTAAEAEEPQSDPLDLGFDEPAAAPQAPPGKPPAQEATSASDDPLGDIFADDSVAADSSPAMGAAASDDDMFNFGSPEPDAGAPAGGALNDDGLNDDGLEAALGSGPDDTPSEGLDMGLGASDNDLDFDIDAHTIGDQAEDTAEIALSSTAASSPSAADDDGELHFAPAGEAEGDFDPFADGAPTAADDLADLGGADDEPSPAPRGADRGKAKAGESAAAKSPAGKSKGKDKDAGGWWPFGKGGKKPDRKSDKSQIEPASAAAEIEQPEPQPAVVQPAASDDDVLDFFEDTPPAAAQPAAAQPAASDDDVLDFFEDTPPAAAKPAAAKPTAAKPAAAKPAPAKPAAAAPAPAKSAADEPDLDFLGSGSDAAAKPSEEDDGLTDFLQDLGLN